jgi:hypothetical protein
LRGTVVLKFHFKIPFSQSCFLNDQCIFLVIPCDWQPDEN